MKKLLSVFLAVLMVISIIPITASAVEKSGTCGENLTWSFDEDTGTLTISGTGEMYDYNINTFIVPWEEFQATVKTIVVTEGVTKIGSAAFRNFKNMTNVSLPNGLELIGGSSFIGCINLSAIKIPNTVTRIRISAFERCAKLTSVEIPDKITTIEMSTFRKCTGLKSVKIPYGVTTIEKYAFDECTSLVGLQLPNSITTIESSAFCECSSLTGISLPPSITSIGVCTFSKCANLTSIKIPKSVKAIGEYAFFKCNKLTDVYYDDSVEVWNEITIGENNTCLTDATIHYGVVHNKVIVPAVPATCTTNGSTEGVQCSICGMYFVEPQIIEANGHTHDDLIIENVSNPTCTVNGSYDEVVYCSVCGEELSRETITTESLGHTDDNDDGFCDTCDEQFCSCSCHKTGIVKIFWRITNIIQNLFGINKVCDCGKVH